jgi:hypothetical protein
VTRLAVYVICVKERAVDKTRISKLKFMQVALTITKTGEISRLKTIHKSNNFSEKLKLQGY